MTLSLRAAEGIALQSRRFHRLVGYSSAVSLALYLSLSGSPSAEAHPHHKASSSSSPSAHHPALIKVSTAKLRSGPGTDKKATALLDEGRSAIVVGKKDGWVKIRLDSGKEGWLRHDLVDIAKARVHDESDDESTTTRRHHKSHSDDDDSDDDQPRARSHHQAPKHKEVALATHSEHHRTSASSHRVAHVTALHVSTAPKTTRVTELKVASNADSNGDTIRTTELRFDTDGEEPSGDAGNTEKTSISSDSATAASSESMLRNVSRGDRLVRSAMAYRGTPYRMGATGNGAFDCSGFTMYLFGKEGSSLPRTAAEQYDKGEAITKDHLQPGDLVFFRNTYKSGISHVGIYIGNNSFVHASGYGRGVRVDSLGAAFYINHWAGARRPR